MKSWHLKCSKREFFRSLKRKWWFRVNLPDSRLTEEFTWTFWGSTWRVLKGKTKEYQMLIESICAILSSWLTQTMRKCWTTIDLISTSTMIVSIKFNKKRLKRSIKKACRSGKRLSRELRDFNNFYLFIPLSFILIQISKVNQFLFILFQGKVICV